MKLPFLHKKDNTSYKLDEEKLPSLSDTQKSPGGASSDLPPLPDSSSGSSDLLPTTPDLPASDSSSDPLLTAPASFSSPFSPPAQNSSVDMNSENIHSEVSRVKIDAIESKIALLDAKVSNVENKIDLILAMMEREVSDETKRELHIDSSMRKRGLR